MRNKLLMASIFTSSMGMLSTAQGATPPPPMPPPPPGLPIDGGLVALFVIALIYGSYKAYKMSKRTA